MDEILAFWKGFCQKESLRMIKLNSVIIKKIFYKSNKTYEQVQEFPELSELDKVNKKSKSTVKRLFQLLKNIFGYHDAMISVNLKKELKIAFRNDIKLFAILSGLIALTLVIIAVLWLFISLAMVAYFYESGNTILHSILFTIGIHAIILIGFSIGILNVSKRFKTQKVYSKFRKNIDIRK